MMRSFVFGAVCLVLLCPAFAIAQPDAGMDEMADAGALPASGESLEPGAEADDDGAVDEALFVVPKETFPDFVNQFVEPSVPIRTTVPAGPVPLPPAPQVVTTPSLTDNLLPELSKVSGGTFALLILLAIALALSRRARNQLGPSGLIPAALRVSSWVISITIVVLLVAIVPSTVVWLAPGYEPALQWTVIAIAVAFGWSTVGLFRDVLAWVVLKLERRIRVGAWISADDIEGSVQAMTLRAVWVRDRRGRRVAIPNRRILGVTVATQGGGSSPIHDVTLRLPDGPAITMRQALIDAVLMSPWTRTGSSPEVTRDGRDPSLWRVRAQLLHVRFAVHFESQLAERVEEILGANGGSS